MSNRTNSPGTQQPVTLPTHVEDRGDGNVAPSTSHGGQFSDFGKPPVPKYETPQDQLDPSGRVLGSEDGNAESQHLGRRYVPGSARGGPASTVPLYGRKRG